MWRNPFQSHGLLCDISGIPALINFNFNFNFKGQRALKYKTLLTQEMLAKGYLASTSVYSCIDHTGDVLDSYFNALDDILYLIAACESGRDVMTLLRGPVCHSGFGRLN
jgi:glutamate-1-semialdehyde 2,1-aminomutase